MQKPDSRLTGWRFIGDAGAFELPQADETSHLYFPLANESGMLSNVTPLLHGDIKSNHYTFLTPPVSVEDLSMSRASRNFWVHVEGEGVWSAAGQSAPQTARRFSAEAEENRMEGGFLWHKVTRANKELGLQAELVSFVPMTEDRVELMQVRLTNAGSRKLRVTPTAVIPLYGRSADEIRDHRHVTSLLHRVQCDRYGVVLQPSLSFDERGHRVNEVAYSVFGAEGDGTEPEGFYTTLETFVGEGGTLDWPEAVVRGLPPEAYAGSSSEGYEAVGGLRFRTLELAPGQSAVYVLAMALTDQRPDVQRLADKYLSAGAFEEQWQGNQAAWERKLSTIGFHSADRRFDLWMRWVTLQPVLRRLYGNSFMPHHDYGRGGRGWRDLWQDCLALLMMEPQHVRHLLLNNFAGVRIDGSNATIIGSQPGEFLADRNNIPRVWMDHGAWPWLTTRLYLQQTGDLAFLLEDQTYFRDSHLMRCQERDAEWTPAQGKSLLDEAGQLYKGTILEHLLLQNLVPFFHVGDRNSIRLEGADWNDGMDMATVRGESVAFTALYASNLRELAETVRELGARIGCTHIEVAEEMLVLFDTRGDCPVDYSDPAAKRQLLTGYMAAAGRRVSGKRAQLGVEEAAHDLLAKAEWLGEHLRANEWVQSEDGSEWFNGYYNNDGERVEGDHPQGVRMTLTGQVFPIMGRVATEEQVSRIVRAVDRHLLDPQIGFRLNTRFGGIQQKLGRAFGFAFGHKENGAMFSHMTVMYANALYQRGFAREGHRVLSSIYSLSVDFPKARIYPGIPEYVNEKGRGMYHYLTGSASWYLLTLLTEAYGVRGCYGDLELHPKLMPEQFDAESKASVHLQFAGRSLDVTYQLNTPEKEYGSYTIAAVRLNGEELEAASDGQSYTIPRHRLESLSPEQTHAVVVTLA